MNINQIFSIFFVLFFAFSMKMLFATMQHKMQREVFKNYLQANPQLFFKEFCEQVDEKQQWHQDSCTLTVLFRQKNHWRPVCANLSHGTQLRDRYFIFRSKCAGFEEEQELLFADCY